MSKKNEMHLDGEKHPFQGNGRTPAPKRGKSAACHTTAAGSVPAGQTANAAWGSKEKKGGMK